MKEINIFIVPALNLFRNIMTQYVLFLPHTPKTFLCKNLRINLIQRPFRNRHLVSVLTLKFESLVSLMFCLLAVHRSPGKDALPWCTHCGHVPPRQNRTLAATLCTDNARAWSHICKTLFFVIYE